MREHEALARMVPPSQPRRGIMKSGILQIQVTRACSKSCVSCTQGSNLAGKPVMMSVEQFEQAVKSLDGYFGVVSLFGGQPTLHREFPELCRILREHVPRERRGLWTNSLNGHGAVCRETFEPSHSNFNMHLDSADAAEFRRDWPEAARYIKGLDTDSVHSSPWVSPVDLGIPEDQRWDMIASCDVNQNWSALVGVIPGHGLRAFFCELAYAHAALHANNPAWGGTKDPMPDVGLAVEPGWWRRPMADFAEQVRTCCVHCGIPLRRPGQLAIGGDHEEFSETHRYIARPKTRGRPVQIIESIGTVERPDRPATDYLPNTTPKQR